MIRYFVAFSLSQLWDINVIEPIINDIKQKNDMVPLYNKCFLCLM
jgi:hypothetical protein